MSNKQPVYLTEKNLGLILNELFPENDFIHNRVVPNSSSRRCRPDYRSDNLKLILEFDGFSHYCKANVIKMDIKKDNDYALLGYRIFRIPYFVQIDSNVLKDIFGINIEFGQRYEHGFIDGNAVLPCDFCELGIESFRKDLVRFNYIRSDIINSLRYKIEEKGDIDLVLPKSLVGELRW